jgi:hypothetical protein
MFNPLAIAIKAKGTIKVAKNICDISIVRYKILIKPVPSKAVDGDVK